MKQAYIDNIDGKIDDDIFGWLIADYKQDERKIIRELERRKDADHGYLDEGIRPIGVAKDARRMVPEGRPGRSQTDPVASTIELHVGGNLRKLP